MSMISRGRVLRWQVFELGILDTLSTATEPGVTGVASGYDRRYREPIKKPASASTGGPGGPGETNRSERIVEVRGQFELPKEGEIRMAVMGNLPQTEVKIVCHFEDLEAAGLVEPSNGRPLIREMTRLIKCSHRSGRLIEDFSTRNLYAKEALSASFGLAGGDRNLLILSFAQRDQGASTS